MLRREDVERALAAFSEAGYHVDLPFPALAGQGSSRRRYIDVVFSSETGSFAWTITGSSTDACGSHRHTGLAVSGRGVAVVQCLRPGARTL